MTKSSASAPRGTIDFTPFSTKPSSVRVALVRSSSGSNSGRGSVSASAAAGTSSPVKAGRYVACCSSVPHRDRAVLTAPGARAATARPMSPLASASWTSVPAIADRSVEMPPSSSGTPRIGRPISRLAFRTASGAAVASFASAAAGRTTSAANSVTTSTSICSSSVGVRSNLPVLAAAGTRAPAFFLPARANCRLTAPTVRKPVRVASKTTRSVGLRSPNRSRALVWASLLRRETAYPMGSAFSREASPCRLGGVATGESLRGGVVAVM